jgi:hypothetical protein
LARKESTLLRRLRLPQGIRGELQLAGACLLVGLLLMPCLIWITGRTVLGPYAHGSVFALLGDFFAGLSHGSLPFWTIALGPWLLLQFVRLGYRLLH